MPARVKLICAEGVGIVLTPPASAISQLPAAIASSARWIAISDEEQAVSIGSLGPCRLRK